MADVLKGKKVAILAADMFERVELEEPRKALEDAGADVEVVSIHDGEIKGFDHFDPANTVPVDHTVDEVSPDDYDALVEAARVLTRAHPAVEIRPVDG